MAWQFLDITKSEKHARRLVLDRYAALGEISTLLPVLVLIVARFAYLVYQRVASQDPAYNAVPGSPAAKARRTGLTGSWRMTIRRVSWWLGDDVEFAGQNWGRCDQFAFGAVYTLWLLILCTVETGNDYAHLTKRVGAIAASQLPLQYLLALKYVNPVAYAFQSSHEEINRWHRVIGRVVYALVCLHGLLYVNYYILTGILREKLATSVVIIGIVALFGMSLLNTTAMTAVRHYSYRIFFVTHLLVALAIPPAIFFHVEHARVYMIQALVFFVIDVATRRMKIVTAESSLELIPGTNLVKIRAEVSRAKAQKFKEHPGAHVYLSIPHASRPSPNPVSLSHIQFEFLFNPFTVASVDESAGEITLCAREMNGPMTQTLARLGSLESGGKVPLCIDGPYGVAKRFPDLVGARYDRILLVAGGVGATFIMPLYQYISADNPTAAVEMVWAVREAAEATWPESRTEKSWNAIEDDKIKLYLTGRIAEEENVGRSSSSSSRSGEDLELDEIQTKNGVAVVTSHRRPDLKKIVDDLFKANLEDRVAVVVCGPDNMAKELRRHVGAWVRKGRDVFWHDEGFGW